MTTLSRNASAARLLLDLTALSVKEPTRDRCVRPPSHQGAMCIFRPRKYYVELLYILLAYFVKRTGARSTPMHHIELRYISLGGRTRSCRLVDVHHLAFLVEMIIAASAMEPAASDVTRAVACPASSSMRAASSAYSNFAIRTDEHLLYNIVSVLVFNTHHLIVYIVYFLIHAHKASCTEYARACVH